MFNEKMLDGLSVSDLNSALGYLIGKIRELEGELEEGEDDPRIDRLYELSNCIVRRMNVLIRDGVRDDPRALGMWDEAMRGYEAGYDKFSDAILEDDFLVDIDTPEPS